MSNNDTELFDLCKAVYDATGWDDNGADLMDTFKDGTPIYDSDYLLEKLPEWTRVQKIGNDTGKYSASYELDYTTSLGDTALVGSSGTPLKALLKLTIALSEAGELK